MENVLVNGVKGSRTRFDGLRGVGYKVMKPYSGLAEEVRRARTELLRHLRAASKGKAGNPLLYTVSPPEKITSLEDIHTLYVLVDEAHFGEEALPDEWIRFEVPAQDCLEFHYVGATRDSMSFYQALFARIGNGEINYDDQGYRIEEYDMNHKWDDKEADDNELKIRFPIR